MLNQFSTFLYETRICDGISGSRFILETQQHMTIESPLFYFGRTLLLSTYLLRLVDELTITFLIIKGQQSVCVNVLDNKTLILIFL